MRGSLRRAHWLRIQKELYDSYLVNIENQKAQNLGDSGDKLVDGGPD